MGKTRVHLLAKELGVETKDIIAQLDRMGLRGRKAQSSLEDDEVAHLRAALTAEEKPHVHVGEEKVVADRVVSAGDESLEVQARETVVERRVRANVIRRRTSRVEVMPEAGEKTTAAEPFTVPAEKPSPDISDLIATTPSFEEDSDLGAIAPEIDVSHHEETPTMPEAEEAQARTAEAEPQPVAEERRPVVAPPPPSPTPATSIAAAPAAAPKEAHRSQANCYHCAIGTRCDSTPYPRTTYGSSRWRRYAASAGRRGGQACDR